jgi:hypothetical protein
MRHYLALFFPTLYSSGSLNISCSVNFINIFTIFYKMFVFFSKYRNEKYVIPHNESS